MEFEVPCIKKLITKIKNWNKFVFNVIRQMKELETTKYQLKDPEM